MNRGQRSALKSQGRAGSLLRQIATRLGILAAACGYGFALNPSLDISQYAHSNWTIRDGFSLGNIYAIAQTPDGYLWLGTEFGLFRFDGVRTTKWHPPSGQQLADQNINSLLGARDGTLWIGTFAGLASWKDGKLTRYPQLEQRFIESMFEDRRGTVWAGALFSPKAGPTGLLCAIGSGRTQCYGEDGMFGVAVPALYQDGSGTLWVLAANGIWRWQPGPRRRYPTTPREVSALTEGDNGSPLLAVYGAGLMQLSGDEAGAYGIRDPSHTDTVLPERHIDANKLLRDRDGGLWIGTVERGLIHVHQGRTDVFTESNGLSGDIILSLYEDREGDIWVATTGGLDRFRELPVTTVSVKQGLSSDAGQSVLVATDGSIWIGTHDGLTKLRDGASTIFRKRDGLPGNELQSLFEDFRGRLWAATDHGLAYFRDGRFVAVNAPSGGRVHFIAGDNSGNLWLSEDDGVFHMFDGHFVDKTPWSEIGRGCCAEALLSGREPGGVWLGFWLDGGISYFKNHHIRVSYTPADGVGKGHVADLHMDRDGALWAATQDGGVSRIKDGHVATLTTSNGLPCDTIHWAIEDDERSLWLYTACGLVRIRRRELETWIADSTRRVQIAVWDAADGLRLRSSAASTYGPRVAKANGGKLWFLSGGGVQVVDPHHLVDNEVPPPVHVEQVIADHKIYWQNLDGAAIPNVSLPPLTHDLTMDYTALSLVAPEKVHFKYKLEGQDPDWREVINDHEVQYSNLAPQRYRFRVIASNNSGVWNETGDTFEFSVEPAYYQTRWFQASIFCVILSLSWGVYRYRLHRLTYEYSVRLHERVEERTRIARELHDTLLQSFQGIIIQFQAAYNLFVRNPEMAKSTLKDAIVSADAAIAEARESIQGLRAHTNPRCTLEDLLTQAGQELTTNLNAESNCPAFAVTVEGPPRPMSPAVQEEVYRIGRELLANAFRHAHAKHIEAELRYGEEMFRLRIRDDGIGIDRKILVQGARHGHWGLPGIRERAKRIGAQWEIWSEPRAGTEVELRIRAAIAYARSQGRRRLLSFFRRSGQVS